MEKHPGIACLEAFWKPFGSKSLRSKNACFTDALERVVSMRLDTLLQRLRRGDDLYLWAVLYGEGAGPLAQRCL